MSFAYQIVILTLFSLLLDCVEYVHGVLGILVVRSLEDCALRIPTEFPGIILFNVFRLSAWYLQLL